MNDKSRFINFKNVSILGIVLFIISTFVSKGFDLSMLDTITVSIFFIFVFIVLVVSYFTHLIKELLVLVTKNYNLNNGALSKKELIEKSTLAKIVDDMGKIIDKNSTEISDIKKILKTLQVKKKK